jgi:hypothetical protein
MHTSAWPRSTALFLLLALAGLHASAQNNKAFGHSAAVKALASELAKQYKLPAPWVQQQLATSRLLPLVLQLQPEQARHPIAAHAAGGDQFAKLLTDHQEQPAADLVMAHDPPGPDVLPDQMDQQRRQIGFGDGWHGVGRVFNTSVQNAVREGS